MALAPGTRLGTYEIIAPIGEGGMGQVYRATDTALGRQVAIKILPDAFASDPDRLARFEREAKTLASLNHPHIAAIYAIEKSTGQLALVMELVEGDDLSQRIVRGAIPIDEALPIARQIAEALEAAHEQGIVHRDLKPANIKVRADGTVKVLDFGLAKAMPPISGMPPSQSQATTTTTPGLISRVGAILGTAAYMSPEQTRGTGVDKRTDLWAFGCVVFEMLTTRRAFEGATTTDLLAAIIEREPDWSLLPPATPIGVRRLLRRCLTKDPKKRLHDIADARLDLDDILTSQRDGEPGSARARPAWASGGALAFAAIAIVTAAITWLVAQQMHPMTSDGPAIDATVERLTYDSGVTRMPALSPDGRLLAYASDRSGDGNLDIWVQQIFGETPLRLTDDPADDVAPDFSPDGTQVVFRSERNGGGIYVVSALGGAARLVAQDGRRPRFSPDGSRIAYWSGQFRGGAASASSLFVIALSGGAPTRLLPDFAVANDPVWAPDGQSLLVAGVRDSTSQPADSFDWWRAPIDGTPPVRTGVFEIPLLRGTRVSPSQWTSAGVLFTRGDDLFRVSLSPAGRIFAPPRRLTLGVGPYVDPTSGPDGDLVFARLEVLRAVERASLSNPTEPATRLYADTSSNTFRTSGTTDGSTIVFEREVGAAREIWIKHIPSGRQTLVTRVATRNGLNATVSPDGARIVYTQSSTETGGPLGTGYVIETAAGVPQKLCEACELHGFLADNQRVLAVVNGALTIRVIDVRTGASRDLVIAGDRSRLGRPHVSPDDRWLVFGRRRGTVGKTVVVRFPVGQPVVSDNLEAVDEPTSTGRPAGWSLDSHVVYLLLDTDGFRCLWGQRLDPTTGGLLGKPFVARHFHTTEGMGTTFGNAITTAGFLYERIDAAASVWRLTVPARR